jgi:replicative DNA helicase
VENVRASRGQVVELPVVAGRVPPHDLDAEGAVLSAVMIDTFALDRVLEFLKPEHFYSEAHRRIFEATVDLRASGKPVDVVQVGTWLKDRGRRTGGASPRSAAWATSPKC